MSGLGVGPPLRIGAAIVIPVFWERRISWCWDDGVCVQGERSAAAVVVMSGERVRAIAIDGEEWDVETLTAALPALATLLASLRQ